MTAQASQYLRDWPKESREAAQLVVDQYGEPDEATPTQLTWHRPGPWKRMVATKTFFKHDFPAPHIDAVESFIDYHVPPDKFAALAEFDPYMEKLRFSPAGGGAADPDRRILSDQDLQRAADEGKAA